MSRTIVSTDAQEIARGPPGVAGGKDVAVQLAHRRLETDVAVVLAFRELENDLTHLPRGALDAAALLAMRRVPRPTKRGRQPLCTLSARRHRVTTDRVALDGFAGCVELHHLGLPLRPHGGRDVAARPRHVEVVEHRVAGHLGRAVVLHHQRNAEPAAGPAHMAGAALAASVSTLWPVADSTPRGPTRPPPHRSTISVHRPARKPLPTITLMQCWRSSGDGGCRCT